MHQKRGDLPQRFLSTPSARRATFVLHNGFVRSCISIHALREEGDWAALSRLPRPLYFYPRPPRGGRLCNAWSHGVAIGISIHALREEGDEPVFCCYRRRQDFYPRPPRGGRPCHIEFSNDDILFLSTPSARRATALVSCHTIPPNISIHALREEGDPLQGRHPHHQDISIHALREEGDFQVSDLAVFTFQFLSTPSARRATWNSMLGAIQDNIFLSTPSARRATKHLERRLRASKFLSTPSARRATGWSWKHMGTKKFLSTPSARRATAKFDEHNGNFEISIHALREEGDRLCQCLGC